MLTIEKLRDFGADTEDGLKRCLDMEDFYLDLVKTSMDDSQLNELAAALDARDLNKAFECAHALKGVYANLSLTPLFKPVSEMTELLRSRTDTDYSGLLEQTRSALARLKALAE